MNVSKIRAIIFDMDGVVVDSMQLHLDSWKRILPDMHVGVREIDKRDFGHASRVILRDLLMRRDHGREPTHDEVEFWFRRKSVISCQMARQIAQPIHGFPEFIRRAHAKGYPTALGSAASREFVDAVLEKLNARELFDAIVTVDDAAKPKPDPEIFLKAAVKLGVPTEQCLIIEDSHPGIQAAIAAGGMCCALLTMLQAEEVNGAHIIAKDYDELTRALGL